MTDQPQDANLGPEYDVGEEDVRDVLKAAVATMEEWGYRLDYAAIVVSGRLRNGETFRAVQVTMPTGADADAILLLLLWGAEKVATQTGI